MIRVLADLRSLRHLAAPLASSGEIAVIWQNGGDLDEVVQGHAGSLQLRFEILPGKAALLDDVVGNCNVHPLADLPADIQSAGGA